MTHRSSYIAIPILVLALLACDANAGSETPPGEEAAPVRAAPSTKAGAADPRRPVFPAVDVHLHIDPRSADTALAIFEEQGIDIGLNASGGEPGRGLEESLAIAARSGGRLLPLCNIRFSLLRHPEWERYVTEVLDRCRALGAKGLKVSKYLGLGLTDKRGQLVPVDDPRLDVVFEQAGALGLPVLIHSGDPRAFFDPPDRNNERYDELAIHPSWSFHGIAPNGQPWPTWQALLNQFERRVRRHPNTVFVGAHFGNAAEDPSRVAAMLRRYPNYFIDTAARVPEFGRHPAARMHAFFEEFQDRILFGSDLGVAPSGLTLGSGDGRPGTRGGARLFFARHWAYFESDRRGLPHPTPIQGHWTVDGIGLSRGVLEKVYYANAAKVFGLARNQ